MRIWPVGGSSAQNFHCACEGGARNGEKHVPQRKQIMTKYSTKKYKKMPKSCHQNNRNETELNSVVLKKRLDDGHVRFWREFCFCTWRGLWRDSPSLRPLGFLRQNVTAEVHREANTEYLRQRKHKHVHLTATLHCYWRGQHKVSDSMTEGKKGTSVKCIALFLERNVE